MIRNPPLTVATSLTFGTDAANPVAENVRVLTNALAGSRCVWTNL